MNGWNDTNVLPEFRQDSFQKTMYKTSSVLVRLDKGEVFCGYFYHFGSSPFNFCTVEGMKIPYEIIKAWHKIPNFS